MRIVICLIITFIAACDTRPNPNLCCSDPDDCAAAGLPNDSQCGDGLVCRGNQCIAQVCETSAECDAAAPYCVAELDGRCQETCDADTQCPGFGQTAEEAFCVGGACAECREDMADCSGATPVCAAGACVACVANVDCASGVCASDGSCAVETDIAYVSPTGSASSDCTQASPCSAIERALAVTDRPFILIDAGTYTRVATLTITGVRRLIGRGVTRPIITRSAAGPIVSLSGGVDASLENVEISGALGGSAPDATAARGVHCVQGGGAPKLALIDSIIRANNFDGVRATKCTVTAIRTTFVDNVEHAIEIVDGDGTIESCLLTRNGGASAAQLDGGIFKVTNSMFVRNRGTGLTVFSFSTGNVIEFNTIVDNTLVGMFGVGVQCDVGGASSFPNNIIARNRVQALGNGTCTFPSSIIADTDITAIKFASPDVAPFDYHLLTGSIAIDAATITANDHDIDGQPRPTTGADVGADELD